MADENTMPDPAAAPAASPPPVQATAPKPNGKAAKPPNGLGQKRGKEIRIPEAAFKERVARAAAAEVRRRLGVPMDQAEALVKRGGVRQASNGQSAEQNTANEAVRLKQENDRLRQAADKAKRQADEAERRRQKDVRIAKDKATEAELRLLAISAGIQDAEKADYAIHMFARAAAQGKAQNPTEYFAGLKTAHAYLFVPAAMTEPPPSPKVAPATSAPPESSAPGEVTPKPSPPGAPPPPESIEDLSPQAFQQRTRSKYGYTPGL